MDPPAPWNRLTEPDGERLLARCRSLDLSHPGSIEALRRDYSPELVSVAVELTLARLAARTKFGDRADTLWADREGVQMASSPAAAAHKAGRFRALAVPVLDLCSGIGADAMALTDAGLPVRAYDLSPVRAWMTHRNAGCHAEAADVTVADLPPGAVHIDPQRRTGADRRTPRLSDLEPGFGFVRALITDRPAACVKLFPGVAFADLPPGEVELVSERGRLRQALLWTGALARHERTATNLSAGATISGPPGVAPFGDIGLFIHAVDPAVERAELMGALAARHGLSAPHPSSGLLTGDAPVGSGLLTPFERLADLPWSPRKVRRVLRDLGAGIVEIKTRGGIVDPDRLQREMRGPGGAELTLFVLRLGDEVRAIIARRVQSPEG